jgi:hypothetical protein
LHESKLKKKKELNRTQESIADLEAQGGGFQGGDGGFRQKVPFEETRYEKIKAWSWSIVF